jgi:predicted DsbA family dithiol-disulfide isomerase
MLSVPRGPFNYAALISGGCSNAHERLLFLAAPAMTFFRPSIYALYVLLAALLACGCRQSASPFAGNADNYRAPTDDSPRPTLCASGAGEIFNNGNSPYRWGDETVKVEVDIVEDLRCPYCVLFTLDLNSLWKNRPDFQQYVRLYFHHFPLESLHPGTTEIHVAAAAAANQGRAHFWALYDEIARRAYDDDQMGRGDVEAFLAKRSGFDMRQFRSDLDSDEMQDFVQWDLEQSEAAGAEGTPTVFVCGEPLPNRNDLESRIDELLGGGK